MNEVQIRENESVVVYIEKVDKKNKYLLLDFPIETEDRNDFEMFINTINVEPSSANTSMLEILGIEFEIFGTPREGSYYVLPLVFLENNFWLNALNIDDDDNDNPYLAFKASASDVGLVRFEAALNYDEFVQNTSGEIPEDLNDIIERFERLSNASEQINFKVRNVGQGNMNELHFSPNSFILYDIGSRRASVDLVPRIEQISLQYNRSKRLKQALNQVPDESVIIFILSHWDIDHYNGLLHVKGSDLDQFDLFIVPQKLPNLTSKRVFDIIKTRNVFSVTMRSRVGNKSASKLEMFYNNELFKFYKGSKSSNRNKSGILISAHINDHDIIMPGDHYYNQLDIDVIPNCTNESMYLVIPHHGGNAGTVSLTNRWLNMKKGIISSGENPWGHPIVRVTNELHSLPFRPQLHYTEHNGDFIEII